MRINFSAWGHPSQWDTQAKASYKPLTEAQRPSSTPHLQLNMSEEVLLQLLIPGGMTPLEVKAYRHQLGRYQPTVQLAEFPKLTIEYSQAKVESLKTHIKVFAKQSRYYKLMIHHGNWKICKPTQVQLVLPHMLFSIRQDGKDCP